MDEHKSVQRRDASASQQEEKNTKPVWLRISDAVRTRGLGRSTLYELIRQQKIKTRLVKTQRDSIRGIRLISADSLDQFIEGHGS